MSTLRPVTVGFAPCVLLVASLSLDACSSSQSASPGAADGGTDSATSAAHDAGSTTTAAGGTLSCLAILQCIDECDAADAPCPDACVAKGSPEAVSKATDLANCITAESCTDGPCVQAKCDPSLQGCIASTASAATTGTSLTGSAPPGDVPADMVGSWARANYGETKRVTLNADGTGTYQTASSSLITGCTSTTSTFRTGNAVVTGTRITIYATKVETRQSACGGVSETAPGDPVRVDLDYTRPDATTLAIVESACAAKYPDSPSSASLYCSESLTRE